MSVLISVILDGSELGFCAGQRLPLPKRRRTTVRPAACMRGTLSAIRRRWSLSNVFAPIPRPTGRDALYAATDARFEAMLADGALDGVRALMALGLDPQLPAMKALGVGSWAGTLPAR